MRRAQVLRTTAAVVAGALIVGAVTIALVLRDGVVKRRVVRALSDHLDSDVTIGPLSVTWFPSARVIAEGLSIRRRVDPPGHPPIISATRFTVEPGLWHLLKGRARYVEVEGLRVTVPRRPSTRPALGDALAVVEGADGAPKGFPETAAAPLRGVRVILDRLVARDAQLVYTSSRPDSPPRVIQVHEVDLRDISFEAPMGYRAVLTNPLPRGRLVTTGQFGPFDPDDPGRSQIEGDYVLTGADFNTVKGLAGTVESRGLFSGQLDQMQVDGVTDTDDFQLDVAGHAVPLHTEFLAVVDGTNGDVFLTHVEGLLQDSAFAASGSIVKSPGDRHRQIRLEVEIPAGRVEDFLTLAASGAEPLVAGDVTLVTSFVLSQGEGRAIDRMELKGTIGISDATFSARATQAKVRAMSRRAQGKKEGERSVPVVMGLTGRFTYRKGIARFSSLTFRTPGAAVAVSGTLSARSGALNFTGTARFNASVSQLVGGVKGFFLKIVDPLFRRDGAGAQIPITIQGTQDAPDVTVDKGRILKR